MGTASEEIPKSIKIMSIGGACTVYCMFCTWLSTTANAVGWLSRRVSATVDTVLAVYIVVDYQGVAVANTSA